MTRQRNLEECKLKSTYDLFTSESVTEGHPDKVADQISDAILDAYLAQDPKARVACEAFVHTGCVHVAGQITAEASVDVLRSIEGNDETGVLTTASGRWRYSRTLTFGAGATVRRYKGNAGSAFADVRWRNDWGSTGLRGERLDTFGLRSNRVVIDHNWQLPLGWALQTSLSGGRESGADAAGNLWGAAVSFTAPIEIGRASCRERV